MKEEKSELPEGWRVVRLGDYAKTEKGKKPKIVSKEKTSQCTIPYINIKAFERNIIDEYTDGKGCVICENDDFLMVWDGSRSGYVGKAIKGALGSTLVKIKLPDVDHDFAYYFLQSKYVEINTRAKGVGIPHVDPSIVWNYLFPLPPKPIQQAIVSKIEELFSELDKSIETLRLAQQQLKTYRQAVLKWAFEGKLTEEWRRENGTKVRVPAGSQKENQAVVLSGLLSEFKAAEPLIAYQISNNNPENRELPEGWKWVKIEDVASVGTGATPLKSKLEYYGGSIAWVTSGSLNDEYVRKATDFVTEKAIKETNLSVYPKHTLLVAMYGEGKTRGKCSELLIEACTNQAIAAIYFDKHEPSIKPYLKYFLLKNYNDVRKKSSGGVQPNLNLGIVKKLQFPLPSLDEQKFIIEAIESRLSVADKMEESITQSLQQAEALRQSILKKAFEGELIVEKKPAVYKPKSEYFYQVQLLGLIARASKKKGIAHGEMTIAKYAYFVDKIYNIPTYYDYQRWHLGPYPPEIKKAINNKNFFKKQNGTIQLADEESLFKHDNHYQKEIENAIDDLSLIFSKYSSKERSHKTELLATICKVVEDIQNMDLQAVRFSMREWKIELETSSFKNKAEKFSEAETEKCLTFLAEKGWNKNLLNRKH